jgi:hypothetical protein
MITASIADATSAITYTFSCGRFGDHLMSYCHAKWLAHKFNIPLLYKPFKYSDQLSLHDLEDRYSEHRARKYRSVIMLDDELLHKIDPQADILYIVPYFPETNYDFYNQTNAFHCHFAVDWQDSAFKKELKKQLAPRYPISKQQLSQEAICVAVHVRKGTGYDDLSILSTEQPLKFPPDSFYIKEIQNLINRFHDKKIYFYIFTDHDNPIEIAMQYQEAVEANTNSNMVFFDYRKSGNHHTKNVIEDFFALTQYDYLIRPDSNFSIIAAKVANNMFEVFPEEFVNTNHTITITRVGTNKKNH